MTDPRDTRVNYLRSDLNDALKARRCELACLDDALAELSDIQELLRPGDEWQLKLRRLSRLIASTRAAAALTPIEECLALVDQLDVIGGDAS